MKLKATIAHDCLGSLEAALNNIRYEVLNTVLVSHLHVSTKFGPAEFYVQQCDHAVRDDEDGLCEVRLSGVSLTDDRSYNDFEHAREELESLYKRLIEHHLEKGSRIQLLVLLMLDGPRRRNGSALVEGEPIWVPGKKDRE